MEHTVMNEMNIQQKDSNSSVAALILLEADNVALSDASPDANINQSKFTKLIWIRHITW